MDTWGGRREKVITHAVGQAQEFLPPSDPPSTAATTGGHDERAAGITCGHDERVERSGGGGGGGGRHRGRGMGGFYFSFMEDFLSSTALNITQRSETPLAD